MAEDSRPLVEAILIDNHEGIEGDTAFKFRKGGLKNYENMQMVFVKGFGFKQINEHKDMHTNVLVNFFDHKKAKTVEPVKNPDQCCLKCLIKAHDFSQTDCFLFCISTHGFQKDGKSFVKFLGSSDTRNPKVNVNKIVDLFSDKKCPELAGKPRILMFDACRNDKNFQGKKEFPSFNYLMYTSCKCT